MLRDVKFSVVTNDAQLFRSNALHNDKIIGYVEYNKATGIVTLVNHEREIQRKALAFGGTAKVGDNSASQFEEGIFSLL